MTAIKRRFAVTDGQMLTFSRRFYELEGRFRKGLLNPDYINDKLQKLIESTVSYISDWEKFYKDVFNIEVDLSQVVIPQRREGFNWLVICIPEIITLRTLFDDKYQEDGVFGRRLLSGSKISDDILDKSIISERTIEGRPYAIWVRNRISADKELANLSADKLKEKGIPTMNLEERILLEFKYFRETGRHLDCGVETATLCAGSVFDGKIPYVWWQEGIMIITWFDLNSFNSHVRAREVVA